MSRVTLGFKAFDAHELLCHFIAVNAGLYRRERLEVELADITFTPETELPQHFFQASCGAALVSALQGLGQKIVFVAVDRPMFWIYSRVPHDGLPGLRHGKIATFPVVAPPHQLANLILQKEGLIAGENVSLLPARDDVARLGLLKSGSVDAAVISSAIAPARMAALGFHQLCWFGDSLRIPTTGLAIDQAFSRREPGLVQTLVRIHAESLQLIHGDPVQTGAVLCEYFDVSAAISHETARLYARAFTPDGRTSQVIAERAICSLCDVMAIAQRPAWNEVYTFA
ncbi:MAG: ABC transporter substrate-binding protein [Lysobacterales bacterium]